MSANVRTDGVGPVITIWTRAPERANAALSSLAAARQPLVAPIETTSTSVSEPERSNAAGAMDAAGATTWSAPS